MEIGKWVRVLCRLTNSRYTSYAVKITGIDSKGIMGDYCFKPHYGYTELYECGFFLWSDIKSIKVLKRPPKVAKNNFKVQGAVV